MKWFGGKRVQALCLGLVMSMTAAMCPAADVLFETIPADCLFAVRINNFESSLGLMDQFITGITPIPMSLAMMVKMQLGGLFGDPTLANIKVDGTFGAFGVKMGEQDVLIAVIVPVLDFDKFASGNANIGKPNEKGIYPITQGQGQSDAMAVFVRSGSHIVITEPQKGEALLGIMADVKAKKSTNLAGTLDAMTAGTAAKEPLWAYANIKQINTAFGEDLQNAIKDMSGEIASAGMMDPTTTKSMDMVMQMLKTAMEQSDWLSLSLRPSTETLVASMTMKAVADSDMAGFFVDSPAGKLPLEYFEDGAMMNAAFRMNKESWAKANDWVLDIMSASADEAAKADVAKIKALTVKSLNTLGDSGAFTAKITSGTPSFAGKMAFAIKDEAGFHQVMKESAALGQTGSFKRLYGAFGMKADFTLKPEAAEYAGVKVDQATLTMEGMGNEQTDKMIKAMYGDGFDYRFAVVKGMGLGTFGDKSEAGIKAMIDDAKAGKPKTISAETKSALALLPGAEKMDFFATYNYVRALAIAGPMMQAMIPGGAAPKINTESKSCLVFAGSMGKGAMSFDVAVPKAHVLEIKAAFEQMMQQMQAQPAAAEAENK